MTHALPHGAERAEASHLWAREANDWYVEERWCSERLFDVESFYGAVWDPACGSGRICETARNRGHTIVYSDIIDRGYDPLGMKVVRDFLECDGKRVENIVSNPPFDLFEQFVRHALQIAKHKVAMIWLVRRLNAARWLEETPLERVYLLTPRPSMPPGHVIESGQKPGGGKQDFCWLVWNHAYHGTPKLNWLRRDP